MTRKLFQPTSKITEIGSLPFKTRTLVVSKGAMRAARYAIHRCHLASYTTDSVWAPLSSQMMGRIAGGMNIWARTKNLLCENGFLECDGKSKHGEKCLCFRLGPKLHDAEWRRIAENEAAEAGAKRRGKRLEEIPYNPAEIAWQPSPEELPDIHDARPVVLGLSIDKAEAHRILDEIASGRKWIRRTLDAWHARVDEFSPAYSIGKTGRLFTDGNMLPKEVRAALLIDGEETTEIDVKNCQPLLLTAIYGSPSEESARWQALCESGQVYEDFAACLGMSRNEAKREQFLPFLFGGKRPLAEAYFRNRFPELIARMRSFARTGERSLAHVLQRMESDIMVKGACEAFRALSVHDAVLLKKRDEPAARAMILDLFWKLRGLRPILDPPLQSLTDGILKDRRTKERQRGCTGRMKRRRPRPEQSAPRSISKGFRALLPSNGKLKRGKSRPAPHISAKRKFGFSTKGVRVSRVTESTR